MHCLRMSLWLSAGWGAVGSLPLVCLLVLLRPATVAGLSSNMEGTREGGVPLRRQNKTKQKTPMRTLGTTGNN